METLENCFKCPLLFFLCPFIEWYCSPRFETGKHSLGQRSQSKGQLAFFERRRLFQTLCFIFSSWLWPSHKPYSRYLFTSNISIKWIFNSVLNYCAVLPSLWLQLVDFGFSKEAHAIDQLATYCGSTLYASPEMVLGRPYLGPECDIWGLGVILYAMLTASMPFDDRDWPLFTQSVADADYPEPTNTSLSKSFFPCWAVCSPFLTPYSKHTACLHAT